MKASVIIENSSGAQLPPVYEQLVQALNSVREACPTIPVLSIIWMHPKHPIHQVQEVLMGWQTAVKPTGFLRGLAGSNSILIRTAVCAANAVRLSVKLALLQFSTKHKVEELRRTRFDVVVKTWCFGLQRVSETDDFYYGDLQDRLARRGLRMLLLCGDNNDGDWKAFASGILSSTQAARIPELCLVSPAVPLKMAWLQFQSAKRLKSLARGTAESLTRQVAYAASLDVLAPAVTQTGSFFWIGREVVRSWRPKAVVTLYEGHGWEKILWWGTKTADPRCRTVGYQHTVIFSEAVALTRPFVDAKERSLPDIVLALGHQTRDLLRDSHEAQGATVIPFGTFRYRGYLSGAVAPAARRYVLVIPEGLAFEIETLFKFAYECAGLLPSYTFVLRTHPNWPISEALRDLKLDVLDRHNIVASENKDINADFERSSFVLYRGSSAVLYAVLAGLYPVYLHTEKKLDADPLYGLRSWRAVCATPEQFAQTLVQQENKTTTVRESEWNEAASYLSRYTMPVTEQSIDAFMAEIGS